MYCLEVCLVFIFFMIVRNCYVLKILMRYLIDLGLDGIDYILSWVGYVGYFDWLADGSLDYGL